MLRSARRQHDFRRRRIFTRACGGQGDRPDNSASSTSGKTGGGSADFASPGRLPLIPWEDGSAWRPRRTLSDRAEGACPRAAGQGGGPGADGSGPAHGDRTAEGAQEPPSAEAERDGEGQRAKAAELSEGPP